MGGWVGWVDFRVPCAIKSPWDVGLASSVIITVALAIGFSPALVAQMASSQGGLEYRSDLHSFKVRIYTVL